jgi:CBS domain-containing protein
VSSDPTFRIGILPPANQPVVSVKPDDDLTTAISRMLHNDFSQLPVMRNDYDVKGIISWASIGVRMALKQPCEKVRECMDARVEIVPGTSSIFQVIPLIVENGYVLVKSNDNKISGIVTASDLSLQFQQVAGPFLLLREIEQHIRGLIGSNLSLKELRDVVDPMDNREIKGVNDLTLGEYVRIFQNPGLWDKLGLQGLSRSEFALIVDQIRLIRNDIMHFDPDPLGPDDLAKLTNFARFLQRLHDLCST